MKTRVLFAIEALACIAILVLFAFRFVYVGLASNSDEARQALEEAEVDLDSAFKAVVAAERAGANVAELLNRLNVADGFLSEGYVDYWGGDYSGAVSLAASCSANLGGVIGDAGVLQSSAERAQYDKLLSTVIATSVGLIALIMLSFLGWGVLKKWFSNRVSSLKPLAEGSE